MFSLPWWLSLSVGFLSLSVEILWVRVAGFAYHTQPFVFSFVLACYLAGIALGAAYGKRLCARVGNLYLAAALVLTVAALGDALTPYLIVTLLATDTPTRLARFAAVIAAGAAVKSILFPIAHHLGSVAQGPRVGRSVSRVYFGNIIGATLGPLVTGFFALDRLSTDECFVLSGAVCLLLSVACVLRSGRRAYVAAPLAAALLLSVFAAPAARPGPGSLVLMSVGREALTHFTANRHGIIHTAYTPAGDYVFGGNVYDGMAIANVDTDRSRLYRVYMLALLHAHPRRILEIGLSAGAWVRAMEGFPEVERIDVVEINPAYLGLITQYPELSPLLADPRLRIHIDDGRRWLKRHPEERYDLIVQNTTYYWRANASNLLSQEYFTEVRRHLNAGGVITANTTGSLDVLATVQAVFPNTYRYSNFVYAADHPLIPDLSALGRVHRPDGTLFAPGEVSVVSVAGRLAGARLEPAAAFIARHHADVQVITDDNLLTEYRHGFRDGPHLPVWMLPAAPAEFAIDEP
jgi:spermidine synthase